MAGTDGTKNWDSGLGPEIILVRPQMGENIGAAARAMKNFGLKKLRVVAPRDGWPNERATAMASRADDILSSAKVFETTKEAVADFHVVYATTARHRELKKPVLKPSDAVKDIRVRMKLGQKAGILFGAEKAGLNNDDIVSTRYLVHVPANPAFSSLNLSQAVLLFGYEWLITGQEKFDLMTRESIPTAKVSDMVFFYERLEGFLDRKGFLQPPEKRPNMVRNLRNIFQKADLTEQEVRTLHGVLSALTRKDDIHD